MANIEKTAESLRKRGYKVTCLETGEMVNIDGTGNRVAGSLYGHRKVYFVAGRNKIAPTLEDAAHRARNVAAPKNAARHQYKTPCAVH